MIYTKGKVTYYMKKSNVPDFETATGTIDYGFTNEYNWPDRSISYASRNFDQLKRGEYYIDAKPVHSIGFLNFTLFEDNPEFNALYQLLNVKTKRLYSEKFSIHVIDAASILPQKRIGTMELTVGQNFSKQRHGRICV